MSDEQFEVVAGLAETSEAAQALRASLHGPRFSKYARLIFAALGSVPWVGGFLAAGAAFHAEQEQAQANELIGRWLEEHEQKINDLNATLESMVSRLEELGQQVDERMQDDGFLGLVRHGFRIWDKAPTSEKRDYVRRVLTNAGATKLCSDDVVRLFLDLIERYHEAHFHVIRVIYHHKGCTRAFIWDRIHGERVREDSADADLFKLLIRDLSTGGVIRQHRPTTAGGQYLSRAGPRRGKGRSPVLESAFEDTKPYELTQLGSQFVHYAMDEAKLRLGDAP